MQKTIGRYVVRSALGQGGMGKVYKVIVPGIEKIAALKLLDPSPQLLKSVGLEQLRQGFIREAAVIANIRHPNIVQIWSLEENKGKLFYLMEYFSHNLGVLIGESYWADRATRMMPIEKASGYLLQILDGLRRLHLEGIVHRDVKPFNIMLTDTGTARIVDFGLSLRRNETPVTKTGEPAGTKFYAAPEQETSPHEVDHRSDLYAAGVLFHRLVTGRLPGDTAAGPDSFNPDLTGAWDRLIQKALAHNPADRFQDAREMSDAIQETRQIFQKQKRLECETVESDSIAMVAEVHDSASLRNRPERILAKHGRKVFEIDELHRPLRYVQNRFQANPSGYVKDHATNLLWRLTGPEYPVTWERALDYVRQMNENGRAEYRKWRLPTVNELLTLLNPPPPGEDYCFRSPFPSAQQVVWSGDTRSKRAAWMVNMELGFVLSGDVLDYGYVRPVCCL